MLNMIVAVRLSGLKQLTVSATRDFSNQRYTTYDDFKLETEVFNSSFVSGAM